MNRVRKPSRITIIGDGTAWVHLGGAIGGLAEIDEADVALVSGIAWQPVPSRRTFYASGGVGQTTKSMHRMLLGLPPHRPLVDHIDGNGLNNKRSNLRTCNHIENGRNRPKYGGKYRYKGVYLDPKDSRWYAYYTCRLQGRIDMTLVTALREPAAYGANTDTQSQQANASKKGTSRNELNKTTRNHRGTSAFFCFVWIV